MTDVTQVIAQVSKGFRLGGINDPLNAPICSEADLATLRRPRHVGGGGAAPADDAPLPGRGHVALAGRRRLGRLPRRDPPARRLALHAGGAAGFGSVDLTALSPALSPGAHIGGPLTQGTFTFAPALPAYNILNTRVGFLNGRWDIAFFVDNVTDELALLALDQERGTLARVGYLTNRPRSFGVSTRIDF